jgi:NAD-dependent deacetylase
MSSSPTSVQKLTPDMVSTIRMAIADGSRVVAITGAGVSAESGLRTYRGDGGLWTEEGMTAMTMATAAYFVRNPQKSWEWYLNRRIEARRASPNRAHHAAADLADTLGDRFTLITQNIDRLHHRAGMPLERQVEIHGHHEGMRCAGHCSGVEPIPERFDTWTEEDSLTDADKQLLTCSRCDDLMRPHVLWFDEFYDEANYGIRTAQGAVARASICITAGTSGGVPIAERLATIAAKAGATLIDLNPRDNALRRLALDRGGHALEGSAGQVLPELAAVVRSAVAP